MAESNNHDLTSSFRSKVTFMKNWKPGSTPSNRDKLELYALHKQAISGDAPSSLSTQSAAERAKYQAWLQKSGLTKAESMRFYMQESDRQVRVYGQAATENNSMIGAEDTLSQQSPVIGPETSNGGGYGSAEHPRGLAAIPLLCAAASESRQGYLRRLANTRTDQAWWGRQEALTATPGSLFAFPEMLLIGFAALIEKISLTAEGYLPMIPIDVLRSFLWPMHNSLLSLWMGYIIIATSWTAVLELTQTIVWGSRRTGFSLELIWKEQVIWGAQSAGTLAEPYQTLTARLVGLFLWFYVLLVSLVNPPSSVVFKSVLYTFFLCSTWWYWLVVLPWLGAGLLCLSVLAGNCFALIELAGV